MPTYHPAPVPRSLSNGICWMMARTAPAVPAWPGWGPTVFTVLVLPGALFASCGPCPCPGAALALTAAHPVCSWRSRPLCAWPASYSSRSAVIIRHHRNPILLGESFLLASVIRLASVCLFRKTSGEAETSISEDDRESVAEPGAPGPNKCLGSHRTMGRPRCPPRSQLLWARSVQPQVLHWPSLGAQGLVLYSVADMLCDAGQVISSP